MLSVDPSTAPKQGGSTSWLNFAIGLSSQLTREELHNMYASPDKIRQIKSRRMRWAGHVARMGQERKLYKVLVGKPEERDHSEDQDVGGRMASE
jgi:hypothetical protein